ncbi:T9SS type A sorting domain-containing protein [bacterium]|nr:T9SS type A sorting domain-containing protein [bacterium]
MRRQLTRAILILLVFILPATLTVAQPILIYSEEIRPGLPRPFIFPSPDYMETGTWVFRRMGAGISILSTFPENETITTFLLGDNTTMRGLPSRYGYDFDDGWEAMYSTFGTEVHEYSIVNEPGTELVFQPTISYPITSLRALRSTYYPWRADHPLFIGMVQEGPSGQRVFSLYRKEVDDSPWYPVFVLNPFPEDYSWESYQSIDRCNGQQPVLAFREQIVPNQHHFHWYDVELGEYVWHLDEEGFLYEIDHLETGNEDGSITLDWTVKKRQIGEGPVFELYSSTYSTAIPEGATEHLPSTIALLPAYPNPFNGTVNIRFELREREQVRVTLFNTLGRKVATLMDQRLPPGLHTIPVDASRFASGVYYYRVEVEGGLRKTRRLVLMK